MPYMLLAETGSTGFNLTEVMGSAVSSVQGDLLGVLVIVVPAIVLVTGAVVGIKFGLKWLHKLGKG